jgi:hypothetical protein
MTLEQYRKALGLTTTLLFAQRVEQMTGVHMTPDLILEAERYKGKDDKRFPMAKPKADAIAAFLTAELGRPITIGDIKGFEVC